MSPVSVAADRTIEVIAVTGQQAPGTAEGVVFSRLESMALNSSGTLAFSAELSGPGVVDGNDEGIWIGSTSAELDLLARSGDTVPGASPGMPPSSIYHPTVGGINDAGQVLSRWSLQVVTTIDEFDSGYWVHEPEAPPREVVRTGTVAPGGDGSVFESIHLFTIGLTLPAFKTPVFNNRGHAAFVGQTDSLTGIFSEGAGDGLAPVAIEDQQAPGFALGVTFNGFTPNDFSNVWQWPTLNDRGETAIWGRVTGPGIVHDENDTGIWRQDAQGELQLVAAAGQAVPEEMGAGSFGLMAFGPTLNNAGDLSFAAVIVDEADPERWDISLWVDRQATGLDLIAKTGDAAPGVLDEATFEYFILAEFPVALNAAGETHFVATLQGDDVTSNNRVGIWTDAGGEGLRLVARSGDPAPAAGSDVTLSFDEFTTIPTLNAAGQSIFKTELLGDGIDDTNDVALWMEISPGDLELILREGDVLDVGGGDLRTVRDFVFPGTFDYPSYGNQDGRASVFNDLGTIALHVDFDDGSEAIVLVIPEPSGWLLGLIGVIATLGFLRRSLKPRA